MLRNKKKRVVAVAAAAAVEWKRERKPVLKICSTEYRVLLRARTTIKRERERGGGGRCCGTVHMHKGLERATMTTTPPWPETKCFKCYPTQRLPPPSRSIHSTLRVFKSADALGCSLMGYFFLITSDTAAAVAVAVAFVSFYPHTIPLPLALLLAAGIFFSLSLRRHCVLSS